MGRLRKNFGAGEKGIFGCDVTFVLAANWWESAGGWGKLGPDEGVWDRLRD